MRLTQRVKCLKCNGKGVIDRVDGDALRQLRESKKVSLRAIARQLNFSAAYLSDVERNRRGCTPVILEAYENL